MRSPMRTHYTFRKEFWKDLPDFDPDKKDYTDRELECYANSILSDDRLSNPDGPRILFQEHIEPDWRREVLANAGVVDETITRAQSPDGQMLYNRTHPEGRKTNSDEQRKKNGASWYR